MVKAFERKVGLIRAVEIWKELEVKKFGAGHPKAWTERDLSKKTWINCNMDEDYEAATGHYQRLNTMVINHFCDMSRQNDQEYPSLMRRNGRIGEMTNSLAITEVNRNIKLSGTSAVKAMDINEGKDLGINVPGRIVDNLLTKAKALGFDDKETAKQFVDSQIKAIKQIGMTTDERKKLSKEIVGGLIDSFNNNPEITHQDQKLHNLVGKNDSLSTNNPNVDKTDHPNK